MEVQELFSGIIGHQTEVEQLGVLLSRRSIPHALLFNGPSGIGKLRAAFCFAAGLLGGISSAAEKGDEGAQSLLLRGTHPDLHYLVRDPERKDLSVEAIRKLCSKLQLKPYCKRCAVALIDDAHEMSIAGSNALLMTLEEPPPNTYIILVTDSPQLLPQTIVSRCQTLHFRSLSEEEVALILSRLLPGLSQELAHDAAAYAGATLTPLNLKQFVNPLTGAADDPEAAAVNLQRLLERVKRFRKLLAPLLEENPGSPAGSAYAVSLATALTADKEAAGEAWFALISALRQKARSRTDRPVWADSLFKALEAEELVRQRNLNPQLQMSRILLNLAAAR